MAAKTVQLPTEPKFWFDHKFRQLKAMHRTVNFVNGARGCGKTFAYKEDAVKQFLDDGSQFVYMRRYDEELSDSKARELFFPNALKEKYPDHELIYKQGFYQIDGKIAGFPFALNTMARIGKSTEYDNVTSVCFDEYIPLDNRFLPDEPKLLNESLTTIGRYRGPQFWLIANNLKWNNPYFIRYKISHPDPGKETRLGRTWSFTLPDATHYKKFMETTPIGAFFKECDPDYFEYAYGNALLDDSEDFIKKQPGKAKYRFTLQINGEKFGVWDDNMYYYISPATDPTTFFILELNTGDLKKNRLNVRKGGIYDRFLTEFIQDNVYYSNMDIKSKVLDIMRYVI